ncbi:MAG: hypothetical protein E3J72_14515 [Planctomycetota bacterium]|nr:MAG: hypothetical protein E3J72_14515 [Planctomycetota bacterium]
MFLAYLGLTAVIILCTLAVWEARRKFGNSGIEVPIIGAIVWFLMTVGFLVHAVSMPPAVKEKEEPVNIQERTLPKTDRSANPRGVFHPPKMKRRPGRKPRGDEFEEEDMFGGEPENLFPPGGENRSNR